MSKNNVLKGFLNLIKAWPLCLASAAVAYFTIASMLQLLAPDIAELIVNDVPTVRLILTTAIAFLFLNMLLVLTYAASLFIVKRESIVDGLRRNSVKLIKGFLFTSISIITCLAVMFLAGYKSVFSTLTKDAFKLIATSYVTGLIASFLPAFPLIWLVASLAGEKLRIGLSRFLGVVAFVFLMLIILSIYGLPGLFIDSMLIPTVVSLIIRKEGKKAEDNSAKGNCLHRLNHGSMRKKVAAITLSILILSTEAFNAILVFGEESRFSEDRLKELVSKAIAEGWGSGELANAIKGDPGLGMFSTYDLSSIAIERDDAGSVTVTIPLNAIGYAIYRKTGNKTTVYDVYLQTGSSEVRIGDKRYVLAGYRSEEKTLGPFETLDEALAKENEVKAYANATRITSNTILKTESREVTWVETRYAVVPTVRVTRYEVLKEFDSHEAAQNYLYTHPRIFEYAEIRMVERKTWVYSYRLVFERETRDRHEAMMVARDEGNYVVEEVRERIMLYVFDKYSPLFLGPFYLGHYYAGEERIRKDVFEKMLETGMVKTGRDLWGLGNLFYYYASEGDAGTRLYKVREGEEQGDVIAWRIYRRIDTSHWENKKVYQVVIPRGYEERKVSIDELPTYAKGFPSRGDVEASKNVVEPSLRSWAKDMGMAYVSCRVDSYEETVARIETVTRQVKQHYVVATFLKPVYDVYELQPYRKVWDETVYEEKWGWVFKGYVDKPPETYDVSTRVYTPEVANWTSKTYLGIVTEWEAQVLTSSDPRYVAEKHNATTITREIAYYDVYNATWRLLYHYYKYIVYPVHQYIANGNISSGGGWALETLGDASGEIFSLTYRSSPSSLRIASRNGRGAWRQAFYYSGGSSPVLGFWYILRGSGAVAVKKPDGSASVFTLAESSGWSRFRRESSDVFSQAGYYTISFIASENSELLVDDVSLHVGGYGEWVYQGDVGEKPENVLSNEKYEAFYKIEDKRLIGTFEESVANQYPTPPYIKEFKKRERVSYAVDLYKLYYLEGGLVRYRVFHWEKQQVPIIVRKEESGAKWFLVESGVEINVVQRILLESNVPESIVRAKYSDPAKYYLAPKVVDSGEALELVCQTLNGNLARRYEEEGYVVESTRVSVANPVRFSMRLLQASIDRNEMGMLGKQNTLRVSIANPTGGTLTYQVILEAENQERVEKMLDQPHGPEAVKRITMVPVAEPNSWLLPVPPGGAPYSLGFTAWIRMTEEREYGSFSRNVAYWPEGSVGCRFIVKVVRNGKLVAKQRVLETFENFDVGRTIARYPFETIGGFLVGFGTTAAITAISIANPLVGTAIAVASLVVSSMNALSIYAQTGDAKEALTRSPLGIVVAPIRALTDPAMDDSARASIIGVTIGAPLGVFVGQKIALDVAMLRMPGELRSDPVVYGKLYGIESNHGTQIASAIARSVGKLYPHLDVPDAKGLVTMILGDALASRRDALYIASMLEWASRMGDEFLRQHAGSVMEWLGSPLLRGKLSSLLQLSPDEALQLSQSVGGDFTRMIRLAEFKNAWSQLSKHGPDVARVFSFSDRGIEIGIEKSLAGKLYPGIQKGTVVEFELARGSIVLKGLLSYADEKTLGDSKYLVFSFKAEERIPYVFELLKEDLQIIPGKQVEKSFGFNAFSLSNGKLTLDKGTLGMDGSVRLSDGIVLRLEDPGIRLVPSDNPLETGMLNKMLLQGRIDDARVIVSEEGSVQAFYGGNYLPAVVTASALGLQLGLLAKPSGEALTIPGESLLARGILDLSLLNVAYPNGETSMLIYTGGSLQIPTLTYSSGAFVGVQAVETRIVWTGINQRKFYDQIASISEILGDALGGVFAGELVKALLLSGLTDSQALDVANELVRNLDWLKTFSEKERIDIVKRIAEYVKRGETAEDAIERAKRESDEYVKNLELDIAGFCCSISDTTLANEVDDLLRHILNTLGSEDARWLLGVFRDVYYEALTKFHGDRELANAKLRSVVEKVFEYPESKLHGCRLASTKVLQLMGLKEEALKKTLEEALSSESGEIIVDKFERTISEYGLIRRKCKFEKGLYLIKVTKKEDEKVFEWSTKKEETSDELFINVPERFKDALIGKDVWITILKYDYSLHFKSKGPNFYFSPRDGLIVEGREIEIERIEPESWSAIHRASMIVKLKQRSIDGAEVYLLFYEDEAVSLIPGGKISDKGPYSKALFEVEENILIIKHGDHKSIVPIIIAEWKEGEEYHLGIPVEGVTEVKLVDRLRKIFGYHNTEELRRRIDKGELMLVAYFDNGRHITCSTGMLLVNIPENPKVLEYVVIRPCFRFSEMLSDEQIKDVKEASDEKLGDYGRDWARGAIETGKLSKIGKVKYVKKEALIKGRKGFVDLVFIKEDGRLIVIEVKTTKTSNKYLTEYLEKGLRDLKNYRALINEYGLDLEDVNLGVKKGEDIEAYVSISVYFDVENKKADFMYSILP